MEDLIQLVAANDGEEEEEEEEGEKYYFEIVEKIDNSGDVSFIGYIDGIEYQLNVSKTVKEARLHTRGGGGREERRGNFSSSSVPEELLAFCPEFESLHKELVTAGKYPVLEEI